MAIQPVCGRVLLLNGGGLDSIAQLILLHHAGTEIESLHVDYGQDAANAERLIVRNICQYRGIGTTFVDCLRGYTNFPLITDNALCNAGKETERARFEMKGRNQMLLSIAVVVANGEFDFIMLANNTAPAYYLDATQGFLNEFNELLTFQGMKLRAIAPFKHMTKLEAVKAAYEIDKNVLQAHSCYRARECGVCPHCIQKKEIVAACVG
jgi:7-cyano-7-deazaguanine synthase in queuosine biosynthesis